MTNSVAPSASTMQVQACESLIEEHRHVDQQVKRHEQEAEPKGETELPLPVFFLQADGG